MLTKSQKDAIFPLTAMHRIRGETSKILVCRKMEKGQENYWRSLKMKLGWK